MRLESCILHSRYSISRILLRSTQMITYSKGIYIITREIIEAYPNRLTTKR